MFLDPLSLTQRYSSHYLSIVNCNHISYHISKKGKKADSIQSHIPQMQKSYHDPSMFSTKQQNTLTLYTIHQLAQRRHSPPSRASLAGPLLGPRQFQQDASIAAFEALLKIISDQGNLYSFRVHSQDGVQVSKAVITRGSAISYGPLSSISTGVKSNTSLFSVTREATAFMISPFIGCS